MTGGHPLSISCRPLVRPQVIELPARTRRLDRVQKYCWHEGGSYGREYCEGKNRDGDGGGEGKGDGGVGGFGFDYDEGVFGDVGWSRYVHSPWYLIIPGRVGAGTTPFVVTAIGLSSLRSQV